MSSSPDNAADHTTPVSNLTSLHKQHRKGTKVQDTPQARGRNTSRYELGRRNRAAGKVTRIYPREMYVNERLPCSNQKSDGVTLVRPQTRLTVTETSRLLQQSVCRPRLHPRTTMPLPLPYYRLSVPLETRPHNTPTSGPSQCPSIRTQARQGLVA
jgi:hypothetical protein